MGIIRVRVVVEVLHGSDHVYWAYLAIWTQHRCNPLTFIQNKLSTVQSKLRSLGEMHLKGLLRKGYICSQSGSQKISKLT